MNQEKSKYMFIAILALKYRLSLSSIKSLFGIKMDSDDLYNIIMKYNVGGQSDEMSTKLRYLFTETANESPRLAAISRKNTFDYIKKFGIMLPRELKYIENDIEKATSSNNKDILEKLSKEKDAYNELFKEEIMYEKFKKDYLEGKVSLYSGRDIIAAYRIKNAISQLVICDELKISRKSIFYYEKKLENPILEEKVEKLNDYVLTLYTYICKDQRKKL